MASIFESVEKMPVWQRLMAWLGIAAAIGVVWYFLFYVDALDARTGAEQGLAKATSELERLEKKKANYLEELREHEERKAKQRENLEILPMSSSAVDNLMEAFQQRARQVGLSFDNWTNEPEERQDVYARLPVKVKARGTWGQVGEFFRQLSEFRKPLSIENLRLEVQDAGADDQEHPMLAIEFEAATYRALSEEERGAPVGASRRRRNQGAKR
ncbi:MAG: type 4a pilus biogenesis protein PilO [Myxococcota bacterium]